MRVDLPPDALVGDVGAVRVTATSLEEPSRAATVHDDAAAAIVRAHDDPAHSVDIVTAAACSTVHAHASGCRHA